MNLKTIPLIVFAPVWVPLAIFGAILAMPLILFRRPADAELIADGIVPTHRRYDRELVERMQRQAMGGDR